MMMAWTNLGVLVVSTLVFLYLYVRSVSPARLERRIGPAAYRRCTVYRFAAFGVMGISTASYLAYLFYPLPLGLSRTFPWPWWVSASVAALILLPSGMFFWRGMRDAGEETMVVKKEHTMYGGIYRRIRHPQAVGEVMLWWVIAFLLHSPFLVLYSFVWLPVFYLMCLAEERDLVERYGETYVAYQRETGRFLPRLGRGWRLPDRQVETEEGP